MSAILTFLRMRRKDGGASAIQYAYPFVLDLEKPTRMLVRRRLASQLLLGAALTSIGVVAACGSSDDSSFGNGGDGGEGNGEGGNAFGEGGLGFGEGGAAFSSLRFDPPAATIVVDGTGPKTASFTLKGVRADGSTVDVPPQSVAFDHPSIATVTAAEPAVATASGPLGGVGVVHAVYKGQSAEATLTVQVHLKDVGPGVSAAQVAALDGVTATTPNDPTNAGGTLLYPYDKTVFPLGLASPTLQWNGSAMTDVYRLHYQEANYTFDGYYLLPSATGRANLAQARWDQITASNTSATAADPLKFSLYRSDGTNAYLDATETWTIAPASVNGAIYYWTTSGSGGLNRIQPGAGSVPTAVDSGKCMGCHGVSADGTTLVAAVETGETTYRSMVTYTLQPGATPAVRKVDSNLYGGNIAVNHDGKYVVFGGKENGPPSASTSGLHFGDATTGAVITGSGIEDWAVTLAGGYEYLDPAFSPKGAKLASVQADSSLGSWNHSELMVADFNESTRTFTGLKSLVRWDNAAFAPGQQALAYPSFTPDDGFIAFNVGDHGAGCHDACTTSTTDKSSLWIISASGGSPIKLDTLNDGSPNPNDDNEAFEPTFNPVERGGYYWVVFSSARTWGNTLGGHGTMGDKRLWVAAIDKTIGTVDPSHPPFYLEGQVPTTMNMRGFWALAACKASVPATGSDAGTPDGGSSCTDGFECCSGFCVGGQCVDVTQVACKQIGDSCATSADCCNSDIISCSSGHCEQPVR